MAPEGKAQRVGIYYRTLRSSGAKAKDQQQTAVYLRLRIPRLLTDVLPSLEAAEGALYSHAQDRSMREQAMNAIRSRLDETTFSVAWAEGGSISLTETVAYSLPKKEWALHPASTVPEVPSAGRVPSNLTRREREVAALVARGLTNRQIATALSISEHTVATHVGKIMRKRGLSSRSQLVAWVAEQHGPPSLDSD